MNGRMKGACVLACCLLSCDVTEPRILTSASGTIYLEDLPVSGAAVFFFGYLPDGGYLGASLGEPAVTDSSGRYALSVELPESDCRRIAQVAIYSLPPGILSWGTPTPPDGFHRIQCGEQRTGLDFYIEDVTYEDAGDP